ncbi:hypothetical protein L2E82_27056 [Cichorium intybus]|uniref:Uncharacterized protein n=1 Tax=Cichorium intybus TaxID=13427 RepID=A0ACB9CS71_CICIN|nr:hypothetical protein L2E82_27056 [Cichorium intybus]
MASRIRVERLLTISHLRSIPSPTFTFLLDCFDILLLLEKSFVNLHAGVDEDLTLSLGTSHQIQSKRDDTVTDMSRSAALYKPNALLMSHRFPTFFSSLSTPHPESSPSNPGENLRLFSGLGLSNCIIFSNFEPPIFPVF